MNHREGGLTPSVGCSASSIPYSVGQSVDIRNGKYEIQTFTFFQFIIGVEFSVASQRRRKMVVFPEFARPQMTTRNLLGAILRVRSFSYSRVRCIEKSALIRGQMAVRLLRIILRVGDPKLKSAATDIADTSPGADPCALTSFPSLERPFQSQSIPASLCPHV